MLLSTTPATADELLAGTPTLEVAHLVRVPVVPTELILAANGQRRGFRVFGVVRNDALAVTTRRVQPLFSIVEGSFGPKLAPTACGSP
jgi:hypothetical protein